MTTLIADIETNGLYREVTTVHCIVAMDVDTKQVFKFYPDQIEDGIKLLQSADLVVGHNWIDYDARVLKKLYPDFKIDINKITDTLVLSHMLYPHLTRHKECPASKVTQAGRKRIGTHSLENWGYIVGHGKVEYVQWDEFDEDMMKRCESDVIITSLLYKKLINDMGTESDWTVAENIEKWFCFVLSEQESYGWRVDSKKLYKTINTLNNTAVDLRTTIADLSVPLAKDRKILQNVFKKDGDYKANVVKWYDTLEQKQFKLGDIAGNFNRISFEPLNPESPKQRVTYLASQTAWKPDEWNYKKDKKGRPLRNDTGQLIKTGPKLTAKSATGIPIAETLIQYMQVGHRLKQVTGWEERMYERGGYKLLSSGGTSCGTNTGRVRHRNIVNVPRVNEFYGRELRDILSTRDGYVLVGCDLSALEARLIGHYTTPYDNGEYAQRLLQEDPHDHTVELLSSLNLTATRDTAKVLNYALDYGAQLGKVAEILTCNRTKAKQVYNLWFEDKKALRTLKRNIESSLKRRGHINRNNSLTPDAYIKGLDGRRVYVRSKHSLLNALIQNAGSTVNKYVTIRIFRAVKEQGIHARFVGNFHDETQCEVLPDHVNAYKRIAMEAIHASTKYFKLVVPMDGDIKIGQSWAETH